MRWTLALLLLWGGYRLGWAQVVVVERPVQAQSPDQVVRQGMAFSLIFSNNGFGIGGYYLRTLDPDWTGFASIEIGAGKDEKEFQFVVDYFGNTIVPGKLNRLLVLPVLVGLQYRVFRNELVDAFRPYVQAAMGPTFAWKSPYWNESAGRPYDPIGGLPHGRALGGWTVQLGVGANFGSNFRSLQGVSFSYAVHWLPAGVQLMMASPRQRVFASPQLVLYFGRMW
ncbi:MAG: hypothetical protein N2561_01615 [Bacteroidetes bacterium]|nr:hypothetical protein [Rhodothermia bacterium]MCS7155152.1 hypothetical protein [Bacteroidota bacterium]MCX7906221.1 hypothetical protein [Bacteroidota bacterium]MDW8138348.1 hypothetical protein [Bacteroidota bacterium]MDW8286033.1 hypothetical protein [Bacteroidota bacterium]